MLYCNANGRVHEGIYLLWSSLTRGYVGAVYLGIQGTVSLPETEILTPTYVNTIDFRLERAHSSFGAPAGQLCVTLEFVQ